MHSKRWFFLSVLALLPPLLLPSGLRAQVVTELPLRDRPLTVESTEILSVGSLSGEEWETFARVAGVAFDAQGNLYILDSENFRVVKVDPLGRLGAVLGGVGGGPGEFGMPLSFSVTPSGEVRVFDLGQQGFSIFGSDGSFQATARMSGDGLFVPAGGLMHHPGGGMVSGGAGGMRISAGAGGGGGEEPRPVQLFTLGDEVEVTTVYEAWNPLTAVGPRRQETTSAGSIRFNSAPQRAFDPPLLVGVLPDGRLGVVDSTTYRVKFVEPGRGVVSVVTRPIAPREVTRRDQSDERARQLEELAERTASGGGGRVLALGGSGNVSGGRISSAEISAMMEERINGMEFAEEIPVLSAMGVDWAGRIWLKRGGRRVGEEGPIDVVTGEGEYLGTLSPGEIEIPDAFGPGGLAAYVERDELDVPRVVVKRLSLR